MIGIVIYEGPSLFNGEEIAVIINKSRANDKTGGMLTMWVLPRFTSVFDSTDSVCHDCPLKKKACYVNLLVMGPNAVQKAYRKGSYALASDLSPVKLRAFFEGEALRVTGFGEGPAVPFEVVEPYLKMVKKNTGYTHQWRVCDSRWMQYLQASVETEQDKILANEMGWWTFRAKLPSEPQLSNEIQCLNEKNSDITCKLCGLCNGQKHNIVIDVHGSRSVMNHYNEYRNA